MGHHFSQMQAFFIDVMQSDFAIREFGIGQNVAQKIARKNGATCTDQGDFRGAEAGIHECDPALYFFWNRMAGRSMGFPPAMAEDNQGNRDCLLLA
jgi:hypothetical protein